MSSARKKNEVSTAWEKDNEHWSLDVRRFSFTICYCRIAIWNI